MEENSINEEIAEAKDDIVAVLREILNELSEMRALMEQWESEKSSAPEEELLSGN